VAQKYIFLMLSKSQIKLIKSLSQKKYRNIHELFIVEGLKGVREFLNSDFEMVSLFSTGESFKVDRENVTFIEDRELKKISALKNPQKVLAIFRIPPVRKIENDGLIVALDGIRDPGNLGTIIRLCDWFGVKDLVCSLDTVDCYNPKVVQASMGSLTRVKINYLDLKEYLKSNNQLPVLGTMLDGDNVYTLKLPSSGILILGNEANGISENIEACLTQKLNIPQFGEEQETESLNVATATAIVLSEFRRNNFTEK
jgi:RNA methyltransferase, TrmH family